MKLAATTLENFIPVWFGNNAFQPMNIYVTKAQLFEVYMIAGGEIGVFNGDLCVGASKLKSPVYYDDYVNIVCSRHDGTGNGFTEGNPITEITYRLPQDEQVRLAIYNLLRQKSVCWYRNTKRREVIMSIGMEKMKQEKTYQAVFICKKYRPGALLTGRNAAH